MKYLAYFASFCALLPGAVAYGGTRMAGVPRATVNQTSGTEVKVQSSSGSADSNINIEVEIGRGYPNYLDCRYCPIKTVTYVLATLSTSSSALDIHRELPEGHLTLSSIALMKL
jgi:hypothetical protein